MATNSLKALLKFPVNSGGLFLGIKNKTLMGWRSELGGSPLASSIAVIPRDQISACKKRTKLSQQKLLTLKAITYCTCSSTKCMHSWSVNTKTLVLNASNDRTVLCFFFFFFCKSKINYVYYMACVHDWYKTKFKSTLRKETHLWVISRLFYHFWSHPEWCSNKCISFV